MVFKRRNVLFCQVGWGGGAQQIVESKRRVVHTYKFDEQSIEVGYVLFRSLKARRHNHRPGQAALRYPPKIVTERLR